MASSTQREIYLDCNATHPLLPQVREGLAAAILAEDGVLGNPASIHRRGQKAKKSVAELRDALCRSLGRGDGDEFILLSGATEAINLAMRGFVADRAAAGRRAFVMASSVEHSAVIDTLGAINAPTRVFEVNRAGQCSNEQIIAAVNAAVESEHDVLLCLQLVNNETGVAFELDDLFATIHAAHAPKPITNQPKLKGGRYPTTPQRVWVLLDGAQALGKLDPARIRRAMHHADYLALSGHKMGAPAGIGSLWVRPAAPFHVQMTGGTQERKRRAGTLNAMGALGWKLALNAWLEHGPEWRTRLQALRNRLVDGLSKIDGYMAHGLGANGELPAAPNTLNFHLEACPEESLLLSLDLDGFCVSSGSACNSGSLKPSRVLTAMGYSSDDALASIRVCLGVETSESDVDAFIEAVTSKAARIREARKRSAEILPEIRS